MFFKNEKAHFFQIFSKKHLIKLIFEYFSFSEVIKYSNITKNIFDILNIQFSFKELSLTTNRIFSSNNQSSAFESSSISYLNQILSQSSLVLNLYQEEYIICYFLRHLVKNKIEFKNISNYPLSLITKILINIQPFTHITKFYILMEIEGINKAIGNAIIKLPYISFIELSYCCNVNEENYSKFFQLFRPESVQQLIFVSSIFSMNSGITSTFINQCSSTIKSLMIVFNILESDFINFIILLIKNSSSIRRITLNNNTINANASLFRNLILAYKQNNHLHLFELYNNTIIYNKTNFLKELNQIYFDNEINSKMLSYSNNEEKRIVYFAKAFTFSLNDIYNIFFCKNIRSLFNFIIEFGSNNFTYIIKNMTFHLVFNSFDSYDLMNSNKIFITKLTYLYSSRRLEHCCNDFIMFFTHYQSINKFILQFGEEEIPYCLLSNLHLKAKQMNIQFNVINFKLVNMREILSSKQLYPDIIIPILSLFPKLKKLTFDNSVFRSKTFIKMYHKLINKDIKLNTIVLKNSLYISQEQKATLNNQKIKVIILN